MKRAKVANIFLCAGLFFVSSILFPGPVTGQKNKDKTAVVPVVDVTRTTTRHETRRLAYGGTVTIVGPPVGSITIEGWDRSEVDVSADIELHAASESDLATLAILNNFLVDEDSNHVRILTTGTHDRSFMKQFGKNVPKGLLNQPWRIDFRIRVPALTDVEVSQGVGIVKLAGVEGALHLSALQSDAVLTLSGGNAGITIQQGAINFAVPARSWHGLGADVKLASGTLVVELPAGFSGDINADVLRVGSVEVSYPGLEPREKNGITPRAVRARAGNGGATLSFTVGDGVIKIKQTGQQ